MNIFSFYPPKASTFADKVDSIYNALWGMTLFFVLVIGLSIFVFMIKYRRAKRPDPPPKTVTVKWIEITWLFIPLIGGLTFFAWGGNVFLEMYSAAPKGSYEIYVIAKQWMWKFQHPSGQREINELHVPIDRPIKLIMVSQDVIHSFYVPAFRIKHDVLPMKYTQVWFQSTMEGSYHLFCAEYCGMSHSQMVGQVVVMKQSDFEKWLSTAKAQDSPASQGEKLLQDLGCRGCHSVEQTPLAPRLEGVFGKPVKLGDGSEVLVDENYIRESILNPQAKVVANYQPVMPSYAGQISEEQLAAIVSYIKSLGGAQ